MGSQQLLRELLDRRVARARARLSPTAAPPDVTAIVVLRELDVAAFARGALEFAFAAPAPARVAWLRAFTRTAFLAGNPDNLALRHRPDHRSRDGAIAWYGPAESAAYRPLSRLLRAFNGGAMATGLPRTATVRVPGAAAARARTRRLLVDVAGLDLPAYLVHLNHALCEPALQGLLTPGERLEIRHVDAIDPALPWAYARVHLDEPDSSRLRLYAALSGAPAAGPAEGEAIDAG